MTAVEALAAALPGDGVWRLLRWRRGQRRSASHVLIDVACSPTLGLRQAQRALATRWARDLPAMLSECNADELAFAAQRILPTTQMHGTSIGALRWALWCELTRADAVSYRAVLVGPRVVALHPMLGMGSHDGKTVVTTLPLAADPGWTTLAEPESIDELRARAHGLIGVRLGGRGRDKGAWGARVAAMLGVVERGHDEPDWRGDVEIKTVPVAEVAAGRWRIVEDPAICMEDGAPMRKLARVLWLCRADLPDGDATIVAWYYLEATPDVGALCARYLHLRPKGPAGTTQQAHYLHKQFFIATGLLTMLCGGAAPPAP
ncbi:MAG: hypothetical protein IPL79_05475 [Myxococcales bacterium]|nr:hypothetical protein [Myxococcales bacterium]